MADVSTITANGVTYNIKDVEARAASENKILTITAGAFSSFPQTVSDGRITADMIVLECAFSNPTAITSNVYWSVSQGQIQLDGSINGSTAASITLGKSSF